MPHTAAHKRAQKKAEKKRTSGVGEQPGKSSVLGAGPLSADALHDALNRGWQRIGAELGSDPESIEAIKLGLFPAKAELLKTKLRAFWEKHCVGCPPPGDLRAATIQRFSSHPTHFSPNVHAAYAIYRAAYEKYHLLRRNLISECRLNCTSETKPEHQAARRAYLEKCRIVELDDVATPYPPPGVWVAENEAIRDNWEEFCTTRPLHDKREGRHPVLLLDTNELAFTAEADDSILFLRNGKLVAFVIRDFCPVPSLLDDIAQFVEDTTSYRKSVRVSNFILFHTNILLNSLQKDDPGSLALVGNTSGARNVTGGFGWARNLKKAEHQKDPEFIETAAHREASVCAFFWNLARGSLPDEVIQAYTDYIRDNCLPGMKKDDGFFSNVGSYTLDVPSDDPHIPPWLNFNGVDLAPPSASFSWNYARYVSCTLRIAILMHL